MIYKLDIWNHLFWKFTGKATPFSGKAVNFQLCIVPDEYMFYDGKTEARASSFARSTRVNSIETLCEPWNMFINNPSAVISYKDI